MALPKLATERFELLVKAAQDGNLALMETKDALTGEPRYVMCAVFDDEEDGYEMFPFGHIVLHPYAEYTPPEGAELASTKEDTDEIGIATAHH